MKIKQHREKLKRLELKTEVMAHYSGYDPPRCGKCCKTDIAQLTIDHVFNDGSQLRKIYAMQKRNICKWLKLNNYPVGYQVLCRKCNDEKKRDAKVYFAGDIKRPSRQELVTHIKKYNRDVVVDGDFCIINGKKILIDELFVMSFKISDAMKPLLKKIDHVSLITEDYKDRT
jgi:hypothetical protein